MRWRPSVCTLCLAAALVAVASGCDGSGPEAPATVEVRVPEGFAPLPVPPQNPLRADRAALGERLFFDPILSRDRTISCGSCHLPEAAFTDGLAKSVGIDGRVGLRNAPTLLNVAYRKSLFWDGGALFLESQALVPLEDPNEMDLAPEAALERLRAHPEYPALFAEAFDGEGPSVQTLAYALAAFQRTLVSAPTAFDRHRAGDATALGAEARAGLALFETHCQACHAGPQLTTDGFENNGAAVTDDDPGRERITFSGADRGTFRVPSLRALARTAPYFHDGRFATLEAVVDHYDRGGDGTPGQSPRVRPLRLTDAERDALVAFLATLDDEAAPVDRSPMP
ncbi:MAG: cytochrome c peroxidase [Bacteroidota bacterium]